MQSRKEKSPERKATLYPWSHHELTYSPDTTARPFPRYGAAVPPLQTKEGDIYVMGGLVNASTVKGDLWIVERDGLECSPVRTTHEGPGPRVGHVALVVGNAFIVHGGDTKVDETDVLDETLYLLNTGKTTTASLFFLSLFFAQQRGNGPAHCPRDPVLPADTVIP